MKKISCFSLFSTFLFLPHLALATPFISGEVGYFGYGNNHYYKNLFDYDDGTGITGRIATGYLWEIASCTQFGLELGFSAFSHIGIGESSYYYDQHIKYARYGADALAILDYHFTKRFDIFAKAGVAYSHQKFSVDYRYNDGISRTSGSEHDSAMVFAPKAVLGVGYDVTDNINLNVSFNHEFQRRGSALSRYSPGVSSMSLGLRYSFC